MSETLDLFKTALGLGEPWRVTRSDFDVAQGRLDLYLEGYSQRNCLLKEDEPADRVESRFECFSGSAVVGMQDSPGLDVGDNAFDGRAESVDDRVIGLAVVAEFGAWRFLGRADDLASLVALVADGVAVADAREGRCAVELPECFGIVGLAGQRRRQVHQLPAKVGDYLDVVPGGLVFPGVQLRGVLP